jgi:hypothetical protein
MTPLGSALGFEGSSKRMNTAEGRSVDVMSKPVKIIGSAGLFLVIIFSLVFILHGPRPKAQKAIHSEQVILSDVDDVLMQYDIPGKDFLASFPAAPQHVAGYQNVIQNGQKVGYDIYVAQSRLGTTYMVNVIRYPQTFDVSVSEKILKSAVDEIRSSNPANDITKSELSTYNGLPSIDFVVENPLAEIQGRAILKGTTLFVISVAGENKDTLHKHYEKFLSSFSFPKN